MLTKKRANNFKDISGKNFGRLTVIALNQIIDGDTLWDCYCKCGKNCIKRGSNLRQGGTKSCGCLGLESRRIEKGESGFNRILKSYIAGAIERNLCFDLTKEQFRKLTQENCHYCDVKPKQTGMTINKNLTEEGKKYSSYIYNGIDRKNNELGYTLENSITCCKICNRAKSSLSYEEFMEYINRIKCLNQRDQEPSKG